MAMSLDHGADLSRRQRSLESFADRKRVANVAALIENLDLRAAAE